MTSTSRCCLFVALALLLPGTSHSEGFEPTPIQRGREAVHAVSSPLAISLSAYENIWKQWGLETPPNDLGRAIQDRYGLHPNLESGYPLGLHESRGVFSKTLGQNCLLCHASSIAGQTVIGLGNAFLDFQSLIEDLSASDTFPWRLPLQMARARGTVEASAGTTYLLQYRDHDLGLREQHEFLIQDNLYEDIPAWWNMRKKKTMFHVGSTDVRAVRVSMAFLLAPTHGGDYIKQQESTFADIKQYLMSLETPNYPFEIEHSLAADGEKVFARTCARCHGTYGPDGKYPNKVIPLATIGTDSTLIDYYETLAKREPEMDAFTNSWLYQDVGPNGEPYHGLNGGGYQAPPLDGVWATAPYFHNGSVPTVYHVINSKTRPAIYQPTYDASKKGYDKSRLGWKITVLQAPLGKGVPSHERRKVCDTTKKGRQNQGHTFGDRLTEEQRYAVIEYLKTL